jgi:hypothetical protein
MAAAVLIGLRVKRSGMPPWSDATVVNVAVESVVTMG